MKRDRGRAARGDHPHDHYPPRACMANRYNTCFCNSFWGFVMSLRVVSGVAVVPVLTAPITPKGGILCHRFADPFAPGPQTAEDYYRGIHGK